MAAPLLNKKIEMALRIAISHGGTLSYNPDMYILGFADNIAPSSDFNNELKKYGTIHYDYSMGMDGIEYYSHDGVWSSFTINNHGRAVIAELNKERNGFLGLKRVCRFLWSFIWPLLGYGLGIAVFCVVAHYLANIDEFKEYSWYMGIWHSCFVVPNFLMHYCLNSDILFFAEMHTTAYSIFFGIVFASLILPQIFTFLKKIIKELLMHWHKSSF